MWKVDPSLNSEALTTSVASSPRPGHIFSPAFGARAVDAQKRILDMDHAQLPLDWAEVMREGMRAKMVVQEELDKGMRTHVCIVIHPLLPRLNCWLLQTEHQKRTFDYAPFIRQYLTCLREEKLLNPLLGLDKEGKKAPTTAKINRRSKGKKL